MHALGHLPDNDITETGNSGQAQDLTNGQNHREVSHLLQTSFQQVEVDNWNADNSKKLLEMMQKDYEAKFRKCRRSSLFFKNANIAVTIVTVILQMFQVLVFQLPGISMEVKEGFATIIPAVTGAVLAIQLKLGWAKKSAKCKMAAQSYRNVITSTKRRLNIIVAGGKVTDTMQFCNEALAEDVRIIVPFTTPPACCCNCC